MGTTYSTTDLENIKKMTDLTKTCLATESRRTNQIKSLAQEIDWFADELNTLAGEVNDENHKKKLRQIRDSLTKNSDALTRMMKKGENSPPANIDCPVHPILINPK